MGVADAGCEPVAPPHRFKAVTRGPAPSVTSRLASRPVWRLLAATRDLRPRIERLQIDQWPGVG